ncbi:MAG: hypothetical protein IJI58_01805 [Bacilli bacterium]|nr:hypothetical protein [Bacilli bacterium]
MANDTNTVDLDKLTGSFKVIEEANNSLNSVSLSNIVLDLDNDLSKISFEHGNCFSNYKDDLDVLTNEIDKLKSEVNELNAALEKTIKSFADPESKSFIGTNLLNNVTQIPVTGQTTSEVQESNPINTIPIGLGIAASGIAGSVGAVAVDSMFHNNDNDIIPDYEEPGVEIVEKKINDEPELDDSIAREPTFDDVTPYHASRDKEVIDKFYNDDN